MFHRPLTTYSLDKLAIMASLGTLILGCAAMEPATSLPEGAIQMEAPLSYQGWWDKTESCAELTGRMDQVTWYVVPGVSTFQTESGEKVGFWTKSPGGTSIILAGDYRDHEGSAPRDPARTVGPGRPSRGILPQPVSVDVGHLRRSGYRASLAHCVRPLASPVQGH